jgi:hypothetical protein
MKYILTILILLFGIYFESMSQSTNINTPVAKSTNLSCTVIVPLSIDPLSSKDYICWPTIPIGSKYILGESSKQDADWKSIYTLTGEPGVAIEISVTMQTLKDNVEISYRLKGTQTPYLGVQDATLLSLVDGKTNINLSADGEYFLHIVYDWVWAHEGATKGLKRFVQKINAQYCGL